MATEGDIDAPDGVEAEEEATLPAPARGASRPAARAKPSASGGGLVRYDPLRAYLAEVARLFGFSETDFARIREANVGPDKADPYTVLGVRREMSNEEIRAAWRKLVRDNHPDKLIAQGLPEELVTLANQKLATINAAYDKVAKERGIS